jgi:hypothetical protein
VEQSSDLSNWEEWGELTGTGQWQEMNIPAANARNYFRVLAVE